MDRETRGPPRLGGEGGERRYPGPRVLVEPRRRDVLGSCERSSLLEHNLIRDDGVNVDGPASVEDRDCHRGPAHDIDTGAGPSCLKTIVQETEKPLDPGAVELDQAQAVTRSRSAA